MCLKNDQTLKPYSSKLSFMWIDFDDIWQKYSKDSRIEFVCFGFRVDLLVITLSSLKLQNENNACMLCASVSCWARFFLQHLRRRSSWIIHTELMIHGSPASREISLMFIGGSEVCFPDSATATGLCRRYHQYRRTASAAARTPVDCSELHQQPVDAVLRPTFVQNFVINCRALQSLQSYRFLSRISSPLLNSVKIAAFAWCIVKIRVIFGVRFERRKVDKKANLHENWNILTLF